MKFCDNYLDKAYDHHGGRTGNNSSPMESLYTNKVAGSKDADWTITNLGNHNYVLDSVRPDSQLLGPASFHYGQIDRKIRGPTCLLQHFFNWGLNNHPRYL